MRIKIKKKLTKKSLWGSGPKYVVAVGALAACAWSGGQAKAAQQPQSSSNDQLPRESKAGEKPAKRYDIPAGTLAEVIAAFQRESGLQVLTASDNIGTIASRGVSGVFTTEQALRKILDGTGVSSRFTSAEVVRLELDTVRTALEVVDRVKPLESIKYTEPLRDTPQTISVITKTMIEQQGATTLRDVLRNVPGLTMTAGEGGVPAGDNLTMRGFSARNDMFVDGSRDLGPQSRDPFNMEQVEVIKGPNTAFTGRGSAGGAVNMVSKVPGLRPVYSFGLNFGTDATRRVTGDINVPLDKIGIERAALRLNGVAHHSGVAGRDATESDRWGIAPALTFGLGTPTRWTLGYFKLKQDNLPDYGIPWVPNTNNVLVDYRDQPAPVPRENYYGLKTRDFERINTDQGTFRFEHEFSDSMGIRNQFRAANTRRDSVTTAPRFASNDSLVINRNGPSWITSDDIVDNQTDFRADFKTGKLRHSFVGGSIFSHEKNERIARTVTGTPTTTLFDPDYNQPFNGNYVMNPQVGDVSANTQAFYAFDTVKFGNKFDLNGGLRWERFDADGVTTAAANIARVDKMLSGRAAAVYKPKESGSIYFSYGTAMNPSLEGLSYNTANTAIDPEKTYTIEAGSKWDVIGQRLSLNGAVFRVTKTNARTPGVLPDDPVQVLQGRQRVSGVELGATGRITRNLSLFGAYTFMDSEIVESNTPAEVGKEFQNTPHNSASVWATYAIKRFTLGGGIRAVGKRYGNNINTRQVDSYWTFDGLASYTVNSHLDLRVNFYNLNDAFYFDRLGGGHLVPGAARSVNFSTNFRF